MELGRWMTRVSLSGFIAIMVIPILLAVIMIVATVKKRWQR